MSKNNEYKISVRGLVEFIYKSGSLDLRFQGKSKMADGIKVHQKIQKSQGELYRPEVSLQKSITLSVDDEDEVDEIVLVISGRADGIIELKTGYVIDEIKGTSQFLEDIEINTHPVHWAQAKIYGAIFCENEGLKEITIQLTYAHFESNTIKRLKQIFTYEELNSFLMNTVKKYEKWIVFKKKWKRKRDDSIRNLDFPFAEYRDGQRKLAVSVYNSIKDKQILFAQAPTGIGKTMSTLFPSIKAMEQGLVDKIFYLSAKTITKAVAEDAIELLRDKSNSLFYIKQITLTAKDKICLNDRVTCYPEKCQYANGHYDRSLDALWDIVNHEDKFSKDIIVNYSNKHKVCPYEFSLDCALFSDIVICDYNYAFDPRVYLRRFFEMPTEEYAFLIDEAHNLVDRARTMYSAEICKDKFIKVKKKLRESDKSISKAIDGINKSFLNVRKECNEQGLYVSENEIEIIYEQFKRRAIVFEKWLTENHKAEFYDDVLDLYFDILGYMRISELYDSGYLFYITKGNKSETTIKLFCINPSSQISKFIDNCRSAVFFSATLSPVNYYTSLLYSKEGIRVLDLPTPFDPENRKLLYATDISVKYKDREESVEKICEYIHAMSSGKKGNYMVFFPSYTYMQQIYDLFNLVYGQGYDIIKQERDLTDDEKTNFLTEFEFYRVKRENELGKSLIGFAVLGGHFSEGIDLKGDLLIGVMIIGVGIPMISFENDLIKNYFDTTMGKGFEFAYQFPGINKVMQSAGRVIRSEKDRGVIVLLDQRYSTSYYRKALPIDWGKNFTTIDVFKKDLSNFWEENHES